MKNWLKVLVIIILVSIIAVSSYYFLKAPLSQPAEHVTSEVCEPSTWEVEVPRSFARFENGVFIARACQSSTDFFGASLIQQGDSPHGWWNLTQENPTAALKKNITIYGNDTQKLTLNFNAKEPPK